MVHERRWLVLFTRYPVHWFMRPFVSRKDYTHVALLSPIGNSQWIHFEWGVDGVHISPVGQEKAGRLFAASTEVVQYDQRERAEPSPLNSILPNTCITLARQVMGLPGRWAFWRDGWALRCELLERGGEIVIPARTRRQ